MAHRYYPFIDGLRALAIIPVLLFHFNLGATGGYIGVDVFFVISGFLITQILAGQEKKGWAAIVDFYERRARRILPALFVVCLLSFIAAYALLMPFDFKAFSRSLRATGIFISNLFFARSTGYFAPLADVQPLLHTWSLAVEEQFYIFYPPFLLMLFYLGQKRPKLILLGVGVVFLLSLAAGIVYTQYTPDKSFFLLPTRAWELMTGALIALSFNKIRVSKMLAEIASVIAVTVIVACCFLYDDTVHFPGIAAVPPVFAVGLLLLVNVQHDTWVGRALSWRPAILVGLISYSLYLVHWPVWVFSRYYLDRLPTMVETGGLIAATIALSVLSYRYVETPVRKRQALASRRAIFIFSLAGIALLVALGMLGAKTDGLPQRFDARVTTYAAGVTDLPVHQSSCVGLAPAQVAVDTLCQIGETVKPVPDFLMWGDSHADSLFPAMSSMAARHGQYGVMAAYHGCPPMPGLAYLRRDDACAAYTDAVLRLIKDTGIKKVILVMRWDSYLLGNEKGSIEKTINMTPVYEGLEGQAALRTVYADLVATLEGMGVEVWVSLPPPSFLQPVSTALAKAAYMGRDTAALMRPASDLAPRRDAVVESLRVGHVKLIDPYPTLCPDGMCRVEIDGRSLYSDNNHLTRHGSIWAQDMLAPFFAE